MEAAGAPATAGQVPAAAGDALLERVLALDTLRFAWHRVEGNRGKPGADGVGLGRFGRRLEANLLALADEVRADAYRPGPLRRLTIWPNGKPRPISILTVRDRVLQRAALDVLTPLVDRAFLPCSFGYRPGRSLHDAVARIVHLRDRGLEWVVDADIRDCFGSLDLTLLERFVAEAVPSPALARLLMTWAAMRRPGRTAAPDRGIPLGAIVSPLLCNLYLHRLDVGLRRRRYQSVRYADDVVILCKSREHGMRAVRALEKVLAGLALEPNPRKTRLVSFDEGFDYLGVRFEGSDYSYLCEGKRVTVDRLPPEFFHYHADGYE